MRTAKMKSRINTTQRILTKLHELAVKPDLSKVERDALIQRFEFSFELLWKCAKEYLYVVERIRSYDPLLQFWLGQVDKGL